MTKRDFISGLWYVGILIAICGCIKDDALVRRGLPTSSEQEQTEKNARETYHIKAGDMLIIKVYPGDEFNQPLEVEVNSDGEINIPLLNRVKVGNITPVEAEQLIAKSLDEKFIVNPSVSLRVKQYHTRTVVVLGEVKRPGTYEFPSNGRLTIMKAVALAGGFTDIAAMDKVRLLRKRADQQYVYEVSVKDIVNGKKKDVEIEPDDLVTVPETFF